MPEKQASSRPERRHALFVGDASLDMIIVADHMPSPDEKVHVDNVIEAAGGVVTNAAVACAHANADVMACFPVGDDEAADILVSKLRHHRVNTSIEKLPGRTCRVVILVEPHGEKRLLLDPGIAMYPSRTAVEELDLMNVAWVHTAVYGEAAHDLIERCRSEGIPWSIDLEPATFPNGIASLSQCIYGAAVVFCNDRAAGRIGGNTAERLLAMGTKSVVRTQGPKGASYFSASGETISIAPPPLPAIIDTTGAGDCLAGWFIAETLHGEGPHHALTRAVVAATLSCASLGAQSSYPEHSEVARCAASQSATNQIKKRKHDPAQGSPV